MTRSDERRPPSSSDAIAESSSLRSCSPQSASQLTLCVVTRRASDVGGAAPSAAATASRSSSRSSAGASSAASAGAVGAAVGAGAARQPAPPVRTAPWAGVALTRAPMPPSILALATAPSGSAVIGRDKAAPGATVHA